MFEGKLSSAQSDQASADASLSMSLEAAIMAEASSRAGAINAEASTRTSHDASQAASVEASLSDLQSSVEESDDTIRTDISTAAASLAAQTQFAAASLDVSISAAGFSTADSIATLSSNAAAADAALHSAIGVVSTAAASAAANLTDDMVSLEAAVTANYTDLAARVSIDESVVDSFTALDNSVTSLVSNVASAQVSTGQAINSLEEQQDAHLRRILLDTHWILGASGKSCNDVCSAVDLHCDINSLLAIINAPENNDDMVRSFDAISLVTGVQCNSYGIVNDRARPGLQGPGNMCTLPGTLAPTCTAKVPDLQRFCFCSL